LKRKVDLEKNVETPTIKTAEPTKRDEAIEPASKVDQTQNQDTPNFTEISKGTKKPTVTKHPHCKVVEYKGCYCIRKKEEGEEIYLPISDFTIQVDEMVEYSREDVYLFGTAVKANGTKYKVQFDLQDFLKKDKFSGRIARLNFKGTDSNLKDIKQLLLETQVYSEVKGVDVTGIHKHDEQHVYVGNEKAIDADGNIVETLTNGGRSALISLIEKQIPIPKEGFEKIASALIDFNDRSKTIPILSTVCSFFQKSRISEVLNLKTPILLIIGESGSGKSETLDNIILMLHSSDSNNKVDARGATSFALAKTSSTSNIIPIYIEEYKKEEKGDDRKLKLVNAYLRSAYDGTGIKRGRADQSVVTYPALSPTVVCGEIDPGETAINERSIKLLFNKRDIDSEKLAENFMTLKSNPELLQQLGHSILRNALNMSDDDIKYLYGQVTGYFASSSNGQKIDTPRVINNIQVAMMGLNLLYKVAADLEVEFPIEISEAYEILIDSVYKDTLNSLSKSKSSIDRNVEELDAYIGYLQSKQRAKGEIIKKVISPKSGLLVVLNVKAIYNEYTGYVGSNGVAVENMDRGTFTGLLQKSEYFVRYGTYATGSAPKQSKGYFLDPLKMKEKGLEIPNILAIAGIESECDFIEDSDGNLVDIQDEIDDVITDIPQEFVIPAEVDQKEDNLPF